ncbi:hypothetical protein [Streptomyces poonensis]|uniref:Uncharacterized protein n=1 Tax=Streptomyces poonensis TaxID=68255 RepID=A0A918PVM4_9ACTN|nr:hypothetical protein [Streptomyces poonensis]GGZ24509.1 hypothetical protein GCM10010365_51030 [Streptomyces poonensis]GLJ89989.1 hypothetical protein GCM10017589_25900 [Streptomyces poonensis]
MEPEVPDNGTWYSDTPSQAEGERDDAGERSAERSARKQRPEVPRTEPSQAEGERGDDVQTGGERGDRL